MIAIGRILRPAVLSVMVAGSAEAQGTSWTIPPDAERDEVWAVIEYVKTLRKE